MTSSHTTLRVHSVQIEILSIFEILYTGTTRVPPQILASHGVKIPWGKLSKTTANANELDFAADMCTWLEKKAKGGPEQVKYR